MFIYSICLVLTRFDSGFSMEDMETKYAMELLFMTMEDPLSQPKEQYVSSVDIVINPLLVQ